MDELSMEVNETKSKRTTEFYTLAKPPVGMTSSETKSNENPCISNTF